MKDDGSVVQMQKEMTSGDMKRWAEKNNARSGRKQAIGAGRRKAAARRSIRASQQKNVRHDTDEEPEDEDEEPEDEDEDETVPRKGAPRSIRASQLKNVRYDSGEEEEEAAVDQTQTWRIAMKREREEQTRIRAGFGYDEDTFMADDEGDGYEAEIDPPRKKARYSSPFD